MQRTFITLIMGLLIFSCQNKKESLPVSNEIEKTKWNIETLADRAKQHLDSTKWDLKLFKQDIETYNKYQEVFQSLNESLLSVMVKDKSSQSHNSVALYQHLLVNDFEGLKQLFQSFFSSIPYNWYSNNNIQSYEGYYASVFYSYFAALGLDVTVEDCTNLGRIDMTLKFNSQVYIFEFKVVELAPEGNALQQVKDKAYADKYRSLNQPIHLIGVEFSKDERNVVGFEVESSSP